MEITRKPEFPEEKLREILIRELNLDVQIDPHYFAYFICAFTDIGCFDSMPWEERAVLLQLEYDVDVTDRTLRNWCSKLIDKNLIQKSGRETFWKTQRFGSEKHRTPVSADDETMAKYFQKKKEYYKAARIAAEKAGKQGREADAEAWDTTYKSLWREFGCCYYRCKGWLFNALEHDYIYEIYELAREITTVPEPLPPVKKTINTKEEFYAEWYTS